MLSETGAQWVTGRMSAFTMPSRLGEPPRIGCRSVQASYFQIKSSQVKPRAQVKSSQVIASEFCSSQASSQVMGSKNLFKSSLKSSHVLTNLVKSSLKSSHKLAYLVKSSHKSSHGLTNLVKSSQVGTEFGPV